ncbi:MAG: hypothetical protein AB1730_07125 [Myxococcota bacterium]
MLSTTLKSLGLLTGRGAAKNLLRLCHAGRLVGALSVSLRATPDELLGPLLHAMGGAATKLKLHDVRTTTPPVLDIEWREVREKWECDGLEALVHNLNDLFRDEPDVKLVAVLGEWDDMLQLWCVTKEHARVLLDHRVLDDARNAPTLRRLLEPEARDEW